MADMTRQPNWTTQPDCGDGCRCPRCFSDTPDREQTTPTTPPAGDAALMERARTYQQRSIELLNKTLSMLTHFVWHKHLRPGEHMWSIPADPERDFDCILGDAISELKDARETIVQQAAALQRAHAERDEMQAKYHELLYSVRNRYPGETRHETALRFIRNAELSSHNATQEGR